MSNEQVGAPVVRVHPTFFLRTSEREAESGEQKGARELVGGEWEGTRAPLRGSWDVRWAVEVVLRVKVVS